MSPPNLGTVAGPRPSMACRPETEFYTKLVGRTGNAHWGVAQQRLEKNIFPHVLIHSELAKANPMWRSYLEWTVGIVFYDLSCAALSYTLSGSSFLPQHTRLPSWDNPDIGDMVLEPHDLMPILEHILSIDYGIQPNSIHKVPAKAIRRFIEAASLFFDFLLVCERGIVDARHIEKVFPACKAIVHTARKAGINANDLSLMYFHFQRLAISYGGVPKGISLGDTVLLPWGYDVCSYESRMPYLIDAVQHPCGWSILGARDRLLRKISVDVTDLIPLVVFDSVRREMFNKAAMKIAADTQLNKVSLDKAYPPPPPETQGGLSGLVSSVADNVISGAMNILSQHHHRPTAAEGATPNTTLPNKQDDNSNKPEEKVAVAPEVTLFQKRLIELEKLASQNDKTTEKTAKEPRRPGFNSKLGVTQDYQTKQPKQPEAKASESPLDGYMNKLAVLEAQNKLALSNARNKLAISHCVNTKASHPEAKSSESPLDGYMKKLAIVETQNKLALSNARNQLTISNGGNARASNSETKVAECPKLGNFEKQLAILEAQSKLALGNARNQLAISNDGNPKASNPKTKAAEEKPSLNKLEPQDDKPAEPKLEAGQLQKPIEFSPDLPLSRINHEMPQDVWKAGMRAMFQARVKQTAEKQANLAVEKPVEKQSATGAKTPKEQPATEKQEQGQQKAVASENVATDWDVVEDEEMDVSLVIHESPIDGPQSAAKTQEGQVGTDEAKDAEEGWEMV